MKKRDWEALLGGLGLVGAGIATGGFGIPALAGVGTSLSGMLGGTGVAAANAAGLGAAGSAGLGLAAPAAGEALATGGTAGLGGGLASLFGPTATQAGLAGIADPAAVPSLAEIAGQAGAEYAPESLSMSALGAPTRTFPSLGARGVGFLRSPGFQGAARGLNVAEQMSPHPQMQPMQRPPGMNRPYQPSAMSPFAIDPNDPRRKFMGLAGYLGN